MKKDPYQIIKHRHVTEKSQVLSQLKDANSNACVARCQSPKYVFIVDPNANKQEIAWAVEEIYHNQGVKVVSVNTINVKAKTRRVRGHLGKKKALKKAVVTCEKGDSIDEL